MRPYLQEKRPDHPRAWKTGWINAHILAAEAKLGRLLRPGEVVHHLDGNGHNNAPENLDVCDSHGEHGRIHAATRARKSGRFA